MLIAILGRQPELSLAELENYFGSDLVTRFSTDVALIDIGHANIDHFGGILKLAHLKAEFVGKSLQQNLKSIQKVCLENIPSNQGKITLGFSWYGDQIPLKLLRSLAMKIKLTLKKSGVSVRLLPTNQLVISTASSYHNRLGKSSKKIEIIITSYQNQVLVGCGIGTQNLSAYRDRDQRRPKRDSKVGMLPPKLAQIIINLSRPKPASLNQKLTLLDPFCGTGVILQEAHLLGFNIVGSDIEPRMVNYSRQNLKWLSQDLDKAKLLVGDATQTKWPHFDCIASETYLGKPFGSPPNLNQITVEKNLVEPIIAKFLKNLRQQIPANSQICLAVPAWLDPNGKYTDLHLIQPKQLQKLGFRYKSFKTVKNADLIYFRPSQSVARRLLVLTPENS